MLFYFITELNFPLVVSLFLIGFLLMNFDLELFLQSVEYLLICLLAKFF